MKFFSFNWIQPLGKRIKEEVFTKEQSYMRIWSIIYPILLYYAVNGIFASLIGRLSILIGIAVVFPFFLNEKAEVRMPPLRKKDIPLLFILGAVAALCFNIMFALLVITGSSVEYAQVAQKQFALPLWTGIFLYGVISPFTEEVVFRGIVYNRMDRLFGRTIAIIGSALLFGAYHGNIVQTLYGFILGVLIAVLYERYGSFLVPVLIHSAANIAVYIVSSNIILQQKFMNWTGCIACGILAIVLFWLLVLRKEEAEP